MSVKRIGLFGNFGGGNLGNEGSLEAMLLFLRQACPDANLVCICSEPNVINGQFGVRAVAIRDPRSRRGGWFGRIGGRFSDLVNMFRKLRNADVLLVPGTGAMDDFGERPQDFPYSVFLACLMAKLRGIKIAFVSIGAGPIRHPVSRWLIKSAARMATYRSYRDMISKEFMQSIGLDADKDPVYPDLAFRLPNPEPVVRAEHDTLTVGLGVMAYYGWSGRDTAIYWTYLEKLATFAAWLLENGYRIRLLVGEHTDQQATKDISEAIQTRIGSVSQGRLIAEMPHSLRDLMTQISTVDAVVATRFHNVLCALKLGTPTISLGYARKNDVLMETMGLGEFCQHVEQFDVDTLIREFTKLIEKREIYRDIVRRNSTTLREQLERQERFLIGNLI